MCNVNFGITADILLMPWALTFGIDSFTHMWIFKIFKKGVFDPTTGSPTITLFQLHSNCHTRHDPQKIAHFLRKEIHAPPFLTGAVKSSVLLQEGIKFGSLDFKKIQLFERDGRCVQSLI